MAVALLKITVLLCISLVVLTVGVSFFLDVYQCDKFSPSYQAACQFERVQMVTFYEWGFRFLLVIMITTGVGSLVTAMLQG